MPRAVSVASRSSGSPQWSSADDDLLSSRSCREPRGTHSSSRHVRSSPQPADQKKKKKKKKIKEFNDSSEIK